MFTSIRKKFIYTGQGLFRLEIDFFLEGTLASPKHRSDWEEAVRFAVDKSHAFFDDVLFRLSRCGYPYAELYRDDEGYLDYMCILPGKWDRVQLSVKGNLPQGGTDGIEEDLRHIDTTYEET